MSQLFSGKDIPYQSFGADAKYRVPTMQNRLGINLTHPLIFLSYPAISVYRANIQCAVTAATSPPQKCAMMALGVRSR